MSTTTTSARTIPSPLLRTATILSFLPAFPLCVAHGVLSHTIVPAIGLVPLLFSSGAGIYLLADARRRDQRRARGKQRGATIGPEGGGDAGPSAGEGNARDDGYDYQGRSGHDEEAVVDVDDGGSVLTHRIVVFVADVVLAAGLMVVLVFTWIGARGGWQRPEVTMLAAYATIPLLLNFLIHLYLAARELVAGLDIPRVVEWTAWRAVPPDCPRCGSRLRPDSLPPIPWYESVSAPNVSLPRLQALSISRPSLPGVKLPKFSGLKRPREWEVPAWMKGRRQYANLFVDDDQIERDRYMDDPDGEPSASTTVIATGSTGPTPVVEEVVVGKKDKKGRGG
ncbi:hypothetical protein MMYC01_204406 [Madurella mycetomatis]|uniref:Uncharacterized protein n=1 Tax=Madurella mycetomatis TaxID=100816 RepID=A0A175W5J7_9PEZI|nr:hypothetical protein MMYC01_204406 [Madurella mycetomatis]